MILLKEFSEAYCVKVDDESRQVAREVLWLLISLQQVGISMYTMVDLYVIDFNLVWLAQKLSRLMIKLDKRVDIYYYFPYTFNK